MSLIKVIELNSRPYELIYGKDEAHNPLREKLNTIIEGYNASLQLFEAEINKIKEIAIKEMEDLKARIEWVYSIEVVSTKDSLYPTMVIVKRGNVDGLQPSIPNFLWIQHSYGFKIINSVLLKIDGNPLAESQYTSFTPANKLVPQGLLSEALTLSILNCVVDGAPYPEELKF